MSDIIPQKKDRYTRQPSGITRYLQEGDVHILTALQRHGVLNNEQIFALSNSHRSVTTLSRRLHDLYHDPIHPFSELLERPEGQRRNIKARSTRIWYKRDIGGNDVLRSRDLFEEHATRYQPPLEHQVFCSTMSFSIERGAQEIDGLTFIPQYQANHAGADPGMTIELDGKRTRLVSDGYVAIEYNGRRMYVFKEEDRATEGSENNTEKNRTHLRTKARQYHVAIGKGLHKSHFDVKSDAILLFTTTKYGRLRNFLKMIEEQKPNGCPYILAAAVPECASLETMPNYIPVFDMHWERAGLPPVKILDLFR